MNIDINDIHLHEQNFQIMLKNIGIQTTGNI